MRKIFVIVLMLVLFSTSCKKEEIDLSEYRDKIFELETEIQILESENRNLREHIERLGDVVIEDEKIDLTSYDESNIEKLIWIDEFSWDEIVVYSNGDFNKTFRNLKEEAILNISPKILLGELYAVNKTDVKININPEDYTYIFKKDDNSYKINVLDENIIEIDGKYYKTYLKASSFGKSVLKHDFIFEPEKVLDKIYSSTFAVRKKYNSLVIYEDGTYSRSTNYKYDYYIDGVFIKELCTAVLKASRKMDNSPLLSNNINSYPLGEFTVYYQAIAYKIDVYYNYIHIYREDIIFSNWYEMAQGKEDIFNKIIEPLK
jgi:hypothetical protein